MLCEMCVLDKFEPKEATNLVNPLKCVKRMLADDALPSSSMGSKGSPN
jgi:hypothetical protein